MSDTESEIQREIMEDLHNNGYLVWRNSNISRYGNKSKFNPAGMPDIYVLVGGILLGIEVKKKGVKASKEQIAYGDLLNKHGATYCIATSSHDVFEFIRTI